MNKKNNMQEIIISIRHAFAERIYSGEKIYELRKCRPNIHPGARFWIYEPLPVGKVTGCFTYRGVYRDRKEKVWAELHNQLGISKEAFELYYNKESFANAWQVSDPVRIEPFSLKEAGIERAPQSYMIATRDFIRFVNEQRL